jgi:predicted negative regulator of RcsB-dependent stress response
LASYGSDEEQLEALKNWWNENGTSLLMGIALVLVVFFGNRWWQGNVNAEKEGASEIYATMMETMAVNLDNAVSDEDLASMRDTYSQLLGEFPDSIYVRYAA